ncbi:MAG: glycosyltransferase [Pseudomonadota bacterium]
MDINRASKSESNTDQNIAHNDGSSFLPLVSIVTVVLKRAAPLAETIKSIQAQTYPEIEHIVIDGGSDDSTIDVIRNAEQNIAFWSSEPDEGIYDAINKGIRRATGHYVLILHAGDTYESEYIDRLVSAGRANRSAIVFSNYYHGDSPVECFAPTHGIYFHHLGLNHSAFLVPKSVYDTVGLYDPQLRIVSDALWMRLIYENDIEFIRAEGFGLTFARGGLSSAQSSAHRELVISEWAGSYRKFFPFLSESAAKSIYLYRFEEKHGDDIVDYIEAVLSDNFDQKSDFLPAISSAVKHIWGLRRLDASDVNGVASRRRLCELLQIDPRHSNIYAGDEPISIWLDAIADLKIRCGSKSVTLHYLEVFSRRSETFIPDLVKRMAGRDMTAHVILCDKRILASDRPYDLLFHFDYPTYPEPFANWVVETLIDALAPKGFLFHFIINGWRLLDRIAPRYQRIPAVYMSHGIDAFDLFRETPYSKFILNVVAELPTARFTAVSEYLRDALVRVGIPESKVHVVHNVAHGRFFENHRSGRAKVQDRVNTGYAARVINIGRLVRWKGQDDLIRAIGILRRKGVNIHTTLVFGGESRDEDYLKEIIEEEAVSGLIEFREAVNFDEEPDFLNQFDMLVSASKYTSGAGARSDTFGMSIIEGIAAGLPTVTTDAGGQPEVAGQPNRYVRIARNNEPESLASEIRILIDNGALDGDNLSIATKRVEHFSPERQLDLLTLVTEETSRKRIRPLLISTALDKGAGGAAQNVHRALLKADASSRLVYRNQVANSEDIPCVEQKSEAPRILGDHTQPQGWFQRSGYTIFSVDTDGIGKTALDNLIADCDVINLHWYARFLSNNDITYLTRSGKPVVFTIRDMHPLTGGCHFFHNCDNWQTDCYPCPQFRPEHIALPRDTLAKKRSDWDLENVTIVTLSEHTRAIVKQSPLFGTCRIEKIPNPIDPNIFRPADRIGAREQFNIPADKKVIAYVPSFNSTVKGAREFELVLQRLARDVSADSLVVLCAGRRQIELNCPFEVHQAGYIAARKDLAAFYSAADVTVVPSLEETFSNTTAESIACGTPVAGFQTGAIAELAMGARGSSAPVGDIPALAAAVMSILDSDGSTALTREANYAYMLENHAPEVIGAKYRNLFEDLVTKNRRQSGELVNVPRIDTLPKYLAARLAALARENATLQQEVQKLRADALTSSDNSTDRNKQRAQIEAFDNAWIRKNASGLDAIVFGFTQKSRAVLRRENTYTRARGIPKNIPIPDNFDEKAYLTRFPDVQKQVIDNKMPSGYYHYLRYGRFEGRRRPGAK